MKNIQTYYLALISILMLSTCCKDDDCNDQSNPDCMNYDPCYGVEAANADFSMKEILIRNNITKLIEADTIFGGSSVRFTPKHHADRYKWLIGSDVLTDREVTRSGFPVFTNVPITLIVEKDNLNGCLDSTELRDTVTKFLYEFVAHSNDTTARKKLPLWGTWEGYNTDNPNDIFKITFGYIINDFSLGYLATIPIAGLPKGVGPQKEFYTNQGPVISHTGDLGYKSQLIYTSNYQLNKGFGLNGFVYIIGDELTVDYSYNITPYLEWLNTGNPNPNNMPITIVNKTFKGKKISNKVLTEIGYQ